MARDERTSRTPNAVRFGVHAAVLSLVAALVPSVQLAQALVDEPVAVFVTSNASKLPVGDVGPRDLLVASGFDVTVVDDDVVTADSVHGAGLLVISSSVSPTKVGSTFATIPVPILSWQPLLFDDLGMTGGRGADRGQVAGQRFIDIIDPAHDLSAGLTGRPLVGTTSSSFSFGFPGPSADVVASVIDRADRAVIFSYETGAAMVAGVAPARRVGFYLGPVSARDWNDAGRALFQAAITHAADPAHVPNTPPTVDAGAEVTIEIGADYVLKGSVSDDGRPSGGTTIGWHVPDGVEVNDPADPGATATFEGVGTYALRLVASDGLLVSEDTVVVTVTDPDDQLRALFVAGAANPPAQERPAVQRLTDLGFAVTVVDDDVATATDASGVDVIVIGSSTSRTAFDVSFREVAVPIVVWEARIFDVLGFTSNATRQGESTQTKIRIVEPLHPAADGLSGTPVVYRANSPLSWGRPEGDVTVIATLTNSPTKATMFSYEEGASMAAGSAAARRIGVFPGLAGPSKLSPDGWRLFDAAIEWAISVNDVPSVEAGPDATTPLSTALALSGEIADDGRPPNSVGLSALWSGPPGTAFDDPTDPLTSVQFPSTGLFVLTLTADDGLLAAHDTVEITVTENPLTAAFVAMPTSGPSPLEVTFDASASSDPGGTITSYSWVLDDGVVGTGVVASHVYATPGVRQVTLTVTDDQGFVDTATIEIDVDPGFNPPPTAIIDADTLNLPTTGSITFTSDRSFDANGAIEQARWDFGDGTLPSFLPDVEHEFTAPGVYQVRLRLTDDLGATAVDRVTVRIASPVPNRVANGLVALYEFAETSGSRVSDTSGVGAPLDLLIADLGTVARLPHGGLRLVEPSVVRSSRAATKVIDAVVSTDEISVEAWVVPNAINQSEPGDIVSISSDEGSRNVSINQGVEWSSKDRIEARLRTTEASEEGLPSAESPVGSLDVSLTHVVFTRDASGMQSLYLDGVLVDQAIVEGDLSNWDPTMPLAFGAGAHGVRPWLGDLHLVAIYSRALTHAEVCTNNASSPGRTVGTINSGPSPCVLINALSGEPPFTVVVDGSVSADHDGTIESFEWDFGDGATSDEPTKAHEYIDPGDYRVTLTTIDNSGASTQASVVVVVRPPADLPSQPAGFADTLGYRAGGGFFDVDEFLAAEAWLGGDIAWTVQYLDRHTPSGMAKSSFGLLVAPTATLPEFSDRLSLSLTVPLGFGSANAKTPEGIARVRLNLQAVASGEYDTRYLAVANNLVQAGFGDAALRLGSEFNGLWPPHSSRGNEQAYIDAFRHVHDLFESVSPDFRFDWTALRGAFEAYAPAAYPGDDYVDYIGMDVYWRPEASETWNDQVWQSQYLDVLHAQLEFASLHGKQVSYPEWAVDGVDEPRFVEEMYRWFSSLPASGPGSLGFQAYFDSGQTREQLIDQPATRAAYELLFSRI